MTSQKNLSGPTLQLGAEGKDTMSQSSGVPGNLNGCFDCNICLDPCQEPVVTLCGHLYCWPCIYKWLQIQDTSFQADEHPKCPVCKAYISASSFVPLYSRGRSPSVSESNKPLPDLSNISPRPPALGMNAILSASAPILSDTNRPNSTSLQFHQQSGNHTIGGPSFTTTFSPTINMVGEIVFAGIFGGSNTNMLAYPYFAFPGNGSQRLRRQEIQIDKSLNRVSIFLFCCIALCLILF